MYVTHIGIKQWLTRWFGTASDAETGDRLIKTQQSALQTDTDKPLFSLGDTKQDVVVSYRPAQTEES